MKKHKSAKQKLTVAYRWLRRRRYVPHAVLLFCALIVLPLGIVAGTRLSDVISTNRALAATRAMVPEHSILEVMSAQERAAHATVLSALVLEDPDRLFQLIGNDLLVMFDTPDLRRGEGAAQIWQYRTARCVVDLFFEPGDAEGAVIAHYEIRPRRVAAFTVENPHKEPIDASACLNDLYSQSTL